MEPSGTGKKHAPPKKLPGVRRVLHLRTTPSTQTLARRLAEEGAPAWTLIRADRQSRGRGRMDRRWSSSKGGLYFSLILRPRMAPAKLADLSLATAASAAKSLARFSGLETLVKPPNDILARPKNSAEPARKVCGILLEASGDTRRVHWVILGIGVNVNNRLPASLREAAALSALAGRRLDPEGLLRALLRALHRQLN